MTAILALIPGVFGFWGIGHIYVGKIWKGLVLLGIGILGVITIFVFPLAILIATKDLASVISAFFILFLVYFLIFIWQVYDAYKLAKYYNQYVHQNGKPPW